MVRDRRLRKILWVVVVGFGLILTIIGSSMVRVFAVGPITVNTTADELNTDGDCSLREAIQAANTNTAVDACAAGSGTDVISFSLTTPAVITLSLGKLDISAEPLSIVGLGANLLAIDGNNSQQVFNITSDIPVSISDLTVRNGNTVYDGGGLFSIGDVTLSDAVFSDNTSGDDGGAINVLGTLVMTNVDVLNNNAAGFGGGINTMFSPVTIIGGRIENNTSGSWAGGLYVNGELTISGTQFISNSAQTYSGAIFAWDNIAVTNATFERNTATTSDVGGIFVFKNATFTDTRFISNTAKERTGALFVRENARISGGEFSGNVALGGTAGALNVDGALYIDGTQFSANRATSDGGALWYALNTIHLSNAVFTENHSGSNGGAIYIETPITMTDTDFFSNTAIGQGGAINANNTDTTVIGGNFRNNHAGIAGSVYENGSLSISGTRFIRNSAQLFSGAILAWQNVDVTNSRFERNSAHDYNVGAIYVDGNLQLTNSDFISNTAGQRYGAIWVGGNVTMIGGALNGNIAQADAVGGMKVDGYFIADNAQFIGNRADADTGALDVRGNLTLTNTDVMSNSAAGTAGGINSFGADVRITGGHISYNTASGNGGGLRADGILTVDDTQFYGNTGAIGGAVDLDNMGQFSGTDFIHNVSLAYGGGVHITGLLWLTGTSFISNTAGADGGGVLAHLNVTMSDTHFINNTSVTGIGGGVSSDLAVSMVNSSFERNTAYGKGGGLDAYGPVTADNTSFIANTSGDRGGGLFADYSVALTDTQFISNTARTFGGGVFSWHSVDVHHSNFERNSATDFSVGAIYADTDIVIDQSEFYTNTARLRDGAVWAGGDATVSSSNFRDNVALAGRAGALDVGGSLWLTDTTFIGNQAATDGGAMSLVGGDGRLVNALFAQNEAGNHGGAMYLEHSGTLNVLHNTIVSPILTGDSAIYVDSSGDSAFTDTIISGYVAGIKIDSGSVSEDYNLFYQNTPVDGTITRGGHSVTGNPIVDADYRLMAGSWAINAGVETIFNTDIDGDTRPAGGAVDIGFDETPFTSDATIAKTVTILPNPHAGDPITYTITFSNSGESALYGVIITDEIPADIANVSFIASGAVVTDTKTSPMYVWQVADLGMGQRGAITVSGYISTMLTSNILTNTAEISTFSPDANLENNISDVIVIVLNSPPVAVSDTVTTTEDTAIHILPLINDTDDNPLSIASVGTLGHGTATIDSTAIVYTPTLNFYGTDSFSYTVSDGSLTNTAIITVNVIPVNDAPLARDDTVLGEENTTITISPLGNDSDVDGDTLMVVGAGNPVHGTAVISGTTIRYTPETNFFGIDNFTYSVSDGVLADTATITVTVAQNLWFSYMPVLFNNYTYAPDLVVSELIATENAVTVTIKNQGFAPVSDGFWVDIYIAPNSVPTQVNQIWSDVAAEGLVWGVDGDALAQLVPGGTLTLIIGDGMFDVAKSNFSAIIPGTPVYAQVDSVDLNTNYGGVLEIDELTDKPYNNISGTISTVGRSARVGKTISPPLKEKKRA